jgi:hypothetical protein
MRITRTITGIAAFVAMTWGGASLVARAQVVQRTSSDAESHRFDVAATTEWIDTKIDLRARERLRFTATGQVAYPADEKHPDGRAFGPDGLARNFLDVIHEYPVSDGGHGALIARIGSGDAAQPFLLGASKEFEAPVAGRLFLGLNQSSKDAESAEGKFQVKIVILSPGLRTAAGAAIGGPPETKIASITSEILEKIPRRVRDPRGDPGDMVNVLVVGTQKQLENVFRAANWVQVDSSVQETLLAGVIDSLSKKDYLTMPMSTLYLFERPQDYGFAHAEPVRVAMSRNHLRAWKSPYTVRRRPLWCIAATHDVGFERDERNNGVTHRIDPAIDGEREYVNDTLSGTGLVARRGHVTPANPLTEAKTATGGSFHSDGRILVLVLANGESTDNY